MINYRLKVAVLAAALVAAAACQEYEAPAPCEGEIVLGIDPQEDTQSVKGGGQGETVYRDPDGFAVSVESVPYGSLSETRATALAALPSTLYWEGTTGTWKSETLKWASASKAVSSGKISTGRYQTATPTAYNYYVSSLPVTFGSGGSTIAATNATDVIAGCTTAATTSTGPSVAMSHIFARTGSLTLNTQTGFTLSGVSWKIESTTGSGGTAGTYNIATKAWSGLTALAQRTVTSSSDLYLVPGTYRLTVSYTLTASGRSQSFTRTCSVSLTAGKVHNITATATGGTLSVTATPAVSSVLLEPGQSVDVAVSATNATGSWWDSADLYMEYEGMTSAQYSRLRPRMQALSGTAGTSSSAIFRLYTDPSSSFQPSSPGGKVIYNIDLGSTETCIEATVKPMELVLVDESMTPISSGMDFSQGNHVLRAMFRVPQYTFGGVTYPEHYEPAYDVDWLDEQMWDQDEQMLYMITGENNEVLQFQPSRYDDTFFSAAASNSSGARYIVVYSCTLQHTPPDVNTPRRVSRVTGEMTVWSQPEVGRPIYGSTVVFNGFTSTWGTVSTTNVGGKAVSTYTRTITSDGDLVGASLTGLLGSGNTQGIGPFDIEMKITAYYSDGTSRVVQKYRTLSYVAYGDDYMTTTVGGSFESCTNSITFRWGLAWR